MLTLSEIVKDYSVGDSTVHALRGVSLSFRDSEFVAILGHSGCGKTTMLNIIGGLDRYNSGNLIINGRSTRDYKDADWDTYRNHSVGFVFQTYNLISHQTVLRNVELALTLSGVGRAERRKRAIEALERVGLGDQINKKPSQMSGGQMQRVAIARALVNNPEIVLADEPTGALDTETSVQIMDILREIAQDRLVIMVTHNPELADTYATRTVRLLDGQIIGDSNPYNPAEIPVSAAPSSLKKPSMSFFTALALSWKNLLTKKGRTLLTAFAGSIGIIGIALILSLSNGIQNYIDRVQEDALSTYPLMITSETADFSSMVSAFADRRSGVSAHELDAVYSSTVMGDLVDSMMNMKFRANDLASFLTWLDSEESGASKYISGIAVNYGTTLRIFKEDEKAGTLAVNPSPLFETLTGAFYNTDTISGISGLGSLYSAGLNIWEPLLDNEELMNTQYDVIAGHWPQADDEVVLIVDENNEINDIYLYSLGIKDQSEVTELMTRSLSGGTLGLEVESWSYEELLALQFRLVLPTDFYELDEETGVWTDRSGDPDFLAKVVSEAMPLYVSGIIRPSENASASAMNGAVGYRSGLADLYLDAIAESDLVLAQQADPDTDLLTGLPFATDADTEPSEAEKAEAFRQWAAGISASEQAQLYTALATAPTEEDLAVMADGMLAGMTREMAIDALAPAAAAESGMDEDTIRGYLDRMSDEELMDTLREGLMDNLRESYAQSAASELENLSIAELSARFSALLAALSDQDAAAAYDAYMPPTVSDGTYEGNLDLFGYDDRSQPDTVSIYAATFEDKDAIVDLINAYNERMEATGQEDMMIQYTDYVGLLMSSITTIINAISYVLVAFVSISLVVSSIMIGIITYISVLERTKEIGILRAIGASKRDVARVFNAETTIVGFCAGAIGILLTVLMNIPISLIVQNLTGIPYLRSVLPGAAGAILVAISIILTLIAGLIPSRVAAKKDPVEALRTE